MQRRQYLGLTGTVVASGLTGCTASDSGDTSEPDTPTETNRADTTEAADTSAQPPQLSDTARERERTEPERAVGSNDGFAHAADPWSDETDVELARGQRITTTLTLPAGTYATRELVPRGLIIFGANVQASGTFDFVVTDDTEYQRFRDQQESTFYQNLSALGTDNVHVSEEIGAGEYVIIFDNTGQGEALPDGELTADVELTTQVPTQRP
jgi:hypothetical protein